MRASAEAVIIGGGVMGVSVAFNLARRGLSPLVLLEQETLASKTSGRSSALIRMHYSNTSTIQMAWRSFELFENFADLTGGGEASFRQPGYLVLAGPETAEGVRKNVALQQSLGVNTRLLTPQEVRELAPWMWVDDLEVAAYEPRSGFADPAGVTLGYAEGARRLGVEVRQMTPATGVRVEGDRVAAVETPRGAIATPRVVNACGAWARQVAQMVGAELPIDAIREQDTVFEQGALERPVHLVVYDAPLRIYFRPEGHDMVLLGRDHIRGEYVDPDDYNEKLDPDFALDVARRMVKRVPQFEEAGLKRGWGCLYAITPDWQPVMDRLPWPEGYFVCAGFSGHGFKLAPAVGEMTAEFILTGRSTSIEVRDYRLSRFAEGALMGSVFGTGFQG